MNKKILFITTSNLFSNPRLVKEIHLAKSLFPQIDVISFRLGVNSDKFSDEMIHQIHFANHQVLSGARDPFFPWLISSVLEKILRFFPIHFFPTKLNSFAFNKRSYILYRFLSKVVIKYDWVVAHNPGAFYPAQAFANRTGSKLGIDVEDYHPGEYLDKKLANMALMIMRAVLSSANYCSFAAPLIEFETEKIFLESPKNWFTVYNGFPQAEFHEPSISHNGKLKVVWFSQNITAGRGLEKFIKTVNDLQNTMELHLFGSITAKDFKLLGLPKEGIVLHKPVFQAELHLLLSSFDIGLVADPPLNKNRELAVTNKIIAYAQAGLYIVSVSSNGHNDFLFHSGLEYSIVNYKVDEINSALAKLEQKFKRQEFDRNLQKQVSCKFSWENVSKPLIAEWSE